MGPIGSIFGSYLKHFWEYVWEYSGEYFWEYVREYFWGHSVEFFLIMFWSMFGSILGMCLWGVSRVFYWYPRYQ